MKKIVVCALLLASAEIASGGGFWMVNPFLQILSISNPPLFRAFLDSGAQLYVCIDLDEHGNVIPGVCVDPPPALPGN